MKDTPMSQAETKSAHTAGELFPVWNGHYWDLAVAPSPYAQSVGMASVNAVIGHTLEDAERLARLWAAAPTMLEALKTTRDAMEASGGWEGDEDVFALIVAAIARAEAQ